MRKENEYNKGNIGAIPGATEIDQEGGVINRLELGLGELKDLAEEELDHHIIDGDSLGDWYESQLLHALVVVHLKEVGDIPNNVFHKNSLHRRELHRLVVERLEHTEGQKGARIFYGRLMRRDGD